VKGFTAIFKHKTIYFIHPMRFIGVEGSDAALEILWGDEGGGGGRAEKLWPAISERGGEGADGERQGGVLLLGKRGAFGRDGSVIKSKILQSFRESSRGGGCNGMIDAIVDHSSGGKGALKRGIKGFSEGRGGVLKDSALLVFPLCCFKRFDAIR
jgi:hypothetical protein